MTVTPFIRAIPQLTAQLNKEGVPGDYAEIGVLSGRTFVHLVRAGKEYDRRAHAFDSFRGMAVPGPHDGDQYPEGRFDMGGAEGFQAHFEAVHLILPADYQIWEGFIPECFQKCGEALPDQKFSLALIDVDHYWPTWEALKFMADRISPSGFLVLDDYLPGINRGMLATKAIDEWLAQDSDFIVIRLEAGQLFLRRKP